MRRMRSWREEGRREEVSGRRSEEEEGEGEKRGIKIEVEVRKEGDVGRGENLQQRQSLQLHPGSDVIGNHM